MVRSWERLRPGLEEALKAGTPFPPDLVAARFPADAPLIGAVALAADAAGADSTYHDPATRAARHQPRTHTESSSERHRPARHHPKEPHNRHHPAGTARTDTARADGAIDGAPVTQPPIHSPKGYSHETPQGNRGPRHGRRARGRLQRRQGRRQAAVRPAKTAVLTISNENGALWTCDFSPFNGSDTLLSVGFVYETLDYVNPLQSGKVTPMLATSWNWGAGNKSLTFTIRQGVKFSNGTPLTANDVAYTFNLLKKYPALDLTGDWSVLSSVTQTGSDQVTMDFKRPRGAVPSTTSPARRRSCPEAIWSKIANPVAYPDTHPVGTGPVQGEPLHLGEHHLHRQPALLAGRACRRSRRWSTRRTPATTQPTTSWPTARPSGVPSTSRASRTSTPPRAPTTTTGSRPP